MQDAAPAPPSFLHMSVSGQRFREAPARRESRNSRHPGPVLSKPFQHQPHTSSNRWQDTEVQVVAVTLIPTQQRYRGPQPLSCPSNHTHVLGHAELGQNQRCLQPALSPLKSDHQTATKRSIIPSSSSRRPLGAGRAPMPPRSPTATRLQAGRRQPKPAPDQAAPRACVPPVTVSVLLTQTQWYGEPMSLLAAPTSFGKSRTPAAHARREGQHQSSGNAFPVEMLGGEMALGSFLQQRPPARAQHEVAPCRDDRPQGPP